MKNIFILVLFFLGLLDQALATYNFTEIYETQGRWRVDYFEARENELQDLVSTRLFDYRFQAEAYAKTLKISVQKRKFKFTATEVQGKSLWKVTQS